MAPKKDFGIHDTKELRETADYYKLNTKAVKDLAEANEENSPEVSEQELRKYRSGLKFKVADWIKIILIKFWFYGAVCFFFFWGLGNYITANLDMMVVLGFAMGAVTDLLINNVIRFIESTPGGYDRFMMFPKRKYWTIFTNIIYMFFVLAFVVTTYNVLNIAILAVMGGSKDGSIPVGVGPILFGVFSTAYDSLFIAMKRLFKKIIKDAKNGAKGSKNV